MKKYLVALCLIIAVSALFYFFLARARKIKCIERPLYSEAINSAIELLRVRKDDQALGIFERVLADEPGNLDALWGKAEVLRRSRSYKESEGILNEILKKNSGHAPSLISLSYIAYKDDKLPEAEQLITRVFVSDYADEDSQALAYMMLGAINSKRAAGKASFFNKIKYGMQIKCHFLRAEALAPDLPEVHLGLGTFYLLAPPVFGRDIDKAIKELELAVKIAPDFATANARLAQCYKKKGLQDKYAFHITRAKELDPDNELLKGLRD